MRNRSNCLWHGGLCRAQIPQSHRMLEVKMPVEQKGCRWVDEHFSYLINRVYGSVPYEALDLFYVAGAMDAFNHPDRCYFLYVARPIEQHEVAFADATVVCITWVSLLDGVSLDDKLTAIFR